MLWEGNSHTLRLDFFEDREAELALRRCSRLELQALNAAPAQLNADIRGEDQGANNTAVPKKPE